VTCLEAAKVFVAQQLFPQTPPLAQPLFDASRAPKQGMPSGSRPLQPVLQLLGHVWEQLVGHARGISVGHFGGRAGVVASSFGKNLWRNCGENVWGSCKQFREELVGQLRVEFVGQNQAVSG
jgi:hypothetical protein